MGLKRHHPSLKSSKYNTKIIIKNSTNDEIIINPSNVLSPLVILRLGHWCLKFILARVVSPSNDKKTSPTMFQNVFKTLRCYGLIVIMNA